MRACVISAASWIAIILVFIAAMVATISLLAPDGFAPLAGRIAAASTLVLAMSTVALVLVGFAYTLATWHQAEATARQVEASARHLLAQLVLRTFDELETSHDDRMAIYRDNEVMTALQRCRDMEQLPKGEWKQPVEWIDSATLRRIHGAWSAFNRVGFLVQHGLISDQALIADGYYSAVIPCWEKVGPFIRLERNFRRDNYGKHFEDLFRLCNEYRERHLHDTT